MDALLEIRIQNQSVTTAPTYCKHEILATLQV